MILALAFGAYWQVIREAGFIWDDDAMLTANRLVQAQDGLGSIWFTTAPTDYFPLTYSSLWLEWKWWGMKATGYHVTNILLHALSCIFFWRALASLKIPGGWFAALLFCVHPVNVESVAWITERKNTLAMFFYMMSAWAFARFQNPLTLVRTSFGLPVSESADANPPGTAIKGRLFYLLSLFAFACALLSKTAVVMFPFVLLGSAWWVNRKITRQDIYRTIPFFALSLLLGAITIWFQYNRAIGDEVIHARDFWTRLAGAGWAIWFYLYKAVLPLRLSFVYPDWKIDPGFFAVYLPGVAVLAVLFLFWKFRKTWGRAPLFAFAYFILMLFPVLGFFQIYFQKYSFVADHWQYFALPAIVALISGWENQLAIGQLKERALSFGALLVRGIFGGAIVALFAALTWQQTAIYKNSERLWNDTLKKNPDCWLALNNLGLIVESKGQRTEAMELYQKSLQIKPEQAEAHNNLGSAFYAMGKLDEALASYKAALKIDPREEVTHYNIANVSDHLGQRAEALAGYREALRLRPEYPDAHNNLACLLVLEGKLDEAISHFREALHGRPDYVDALSNLGSTLNEKGRPAEAIDYLVKAVDLNPEHVDAHYNLGNAYTSAGRAAEAIEHYQAVLKLRPQMTMALFKLGNAFLSLGQLNDALTCYSLLLEQEPESAEAHYQSAVVMGLQKNKKGSLRHLQEAVRLKPNWLEALNNLAWGLAANPTSTFRDGVEAIKYAQRAMEISGGKNPAIWDTLSVAYAQTEQFGEALQAAKTAHELAILTGQTNLAAQIQIRSELYQEGKPYRD